MERISARRIAAVLAVLVTLCGLKGIAELARIESRAALPVVVLDRVEVIAARVETVQPLLADSSAARKGR